MHSEGDRKSLSRLSFSDLARTVLNDLGRCGIVSTGNQIFNGFQGVSNMKKFVKMAVAAAIAGLAMVSQAANIVIDDFTIDQGLLSDNSASFTAGTGLSNSVNGPTANIIGGQRDIYIQKTSGAATNSKVESYVELGDFNFSVSSNAQGFGVIRWDGAHFDGFASIDPTGLGGQDLSAGGIGFFVSVTSADLGFPFTMKAYTDGANYTELTLFSGGPGGYFIPFILFDDPMFATDTGSGINFSSVGALEVIINTGGGGGTIDLSIQLVQSVPEPGTMALAGLALVGIGAARRRKQQA